MGCYECEFAFYGVNIQIFSQAKTNLTRKPKRRCDILFFWVIKLESNQTFSWKHYISSKISQALFLIYVSFFFFKVNMNVLWDEYINAVK